MAVKGRQGFSRHDACRQRPLCIYEFCTFKFFEHARFNCVEILYVWKNMFCYHVTRNAICYISFHLTSKFNTEIYKNSSTSDSVLRPLLGLRPWPTGEFHTPNPMIMPRNSRFLFRPWPKSLRRREEGKRERCIALPVDQRIWRCAVSSSSEVGCSRTGDR